LELWPGNRSWSKSSFFLLGGTPGQRPSPPWRRKGQCRDGPTVSASMALGCMDRGMRRRARSLPGGDQLASHAALILFPSLMALPRLMGPRLEEAGPIRTEWRPTGRSRGLHQSLPQSDGGPRLTGRMHSHFRTLSQAGEAPGRVPGRFPSFTPLRTRALRASVAGRVPGSYGESSAVARPCGWNPQLAGPGYPARKGEAHPSLVPTLFPDILGGQPISPH